MERKIFLPAFVIFLPGLILCQTIQTSKGELRDFNPVVPIILKSAVSIPTTAQANDRLLWYKGKKVDDSTLINTKGTLIRYCRRKNEVIIQPKRDPFEYAIKELKKTEQRKKEFFDVMSRRTLNVLQFPIIEASLKEYDNIAARYSELLRNVFSLEINEGSYTANVQNKTQIRWQLYHASQSIPSLPDSISGLYNQIDPLIKEARASSVFSGLPPSTLIDCCTICDTASDKNRRKEQTKFVKAFYAREGEIMGKIILLKRRIGRYLEYNAMEPELQGIINRIPIFEEFVTSRLEKKIQLYVETYGKDVTKIGSIIFTLISYQRQLMFLTAEVAESISQLLQKLISNLDGVYKYLEEQMDKKNYSVALAGTEIFISLQRQKQIITGDEENFYDGLEKINQKINAFNRFKIEMQIDHKAEWEDCENLRMVESFSATNSNGDFLCLGADSCKFRLFYRVDKFQDELVSYHFGNPFGLILKITTGKTEETQSSEDGEKCWKIDRPLLNLEVRPYAPLAKIDFCENAPSDSMVFYRLHLPNSRESRDDRRYGLWKFDHFDDLIQHKEVSESDEMKVADLEMEKDVLKEEYERHESQPPFKPTKEQMQSHHRNAMRSQQILKEIFKIKDDQGLILFDAKNGSDVIIDTQTTKHYEFEDENSTITIRIKIVHVPLNYKDGESSRH